MDLSRQLSLQLRDWQHLRVEAIGPGSWRVSGIHEQRARCLTLIQRGSGSWRLLEQGRVTRLDPPSRGGATARFDPGHELAPMAGVLRQIAVAPGEAVSAGQRLYLLEAMKMQIQVSASAAGVVMALHAAPGERVRQGQQILTFEPSAKNEPTGRSDSDNRPGSYSDQND